MLLFLVYLLNYLSLSYTGLAHQQQAVWEPPQYALAPYDLDLLTLKVVSESHVTWATVVPILVFLGLSVLDLGPMYATTDKRQTASLLNVPT